MYVAHGNVLEVVRGRSRMYAPRLSTRPRTAHRLPEALGRGTGNRPRHSQQMACMRMRPACTRMSPGQLLHVPHNGWCRPSPGSAGADMQSPPNSKATELTINSFGGDSNSFARPFWQPLLCRIRDTEGTPQRLRPFALRRFSHPNHLWLSWGTTVFFASWHSRHPCSTEAQQPPLTTGALPNMP